MHFYCRKLEPQNKKTRKLSKIGIMLNVVKRCMFQMFQKNV